MGIGQYTTISAKHRRPTATVKIGGRTVRIPDTSGAITLSQAFGQPIAGGTLRIPADFEPKHLDVVEIAWGYNGQELPAFTGFVVNPVKNAYPKQLTVQIRDILYLANFVVEDFDIVLDNKTHDTYGPLNEDFFGKPNWIKASEAIIRLLHDWAGIPMSRLVIPEIYEDEGGSVPWYLGQLTPVSWSGMSPLQACLEILSPLGMWLFCDAAGTVRVIEMSGAPTESMAYVWREGETLLISGAPTIDSDLETVYNQVLVQGANTGVEGAQIRDKFAVSIDLLPDGKHRTMTYSNKLIEYVNVEQAGKASATGVATRLAKEYSRFPRTINFSVKAVPKIRVGSTVGIKSPRIGINNDTPFFVYGMQTTFGGGNFSTSISLDGGIGPDGYTQIPPPTAAFTFTLMTETTTDDNAATSENVVEVFCDGGASIALGGAEIVSWDWTSNSASTPTATGRFAMFLFLESQGTATITLTVTDTNSKTGVVTQTIDLAGDALGVPNTRELNLAADTKWFITPDGGKTYTEEAGTNIVAVPPIGAAGSIDADPDAAAAVGNLANASADLHTTNNRLETPSIVLSTLPGPISFIWQHEANALRIWVAVNNGIHLSTDGGVTFSAARKPTLPLDAEGTSDDIVRWIVESKDTEGVLDILVGRYVFTSFDSGLNWLPTLIGPPNSIASCYISGFERHWVGFKNLPEESSPLRSLEGDTGTWPVDTTPMVTAIHAVTMLVNEPILIAIDSQGRIWHHNVEDGSNAVHKATMPD